MDHDEYKYYNIWGLWWHDSLLISCLGWLVLGKIGWGHVWRFKDEEDEEHMWKLGILEKFVMSIDWHLKTIDYMPLFMGNISYDDRFIIVEQSIA